MRVEDDTVSIDLTRQTVVAVLVLVAVLGVGGWTLLSATPQSDADVTQVDSQRFEEIVSDQDTFVLQVHTPYYGEIPETDMVREDWNNIDGYIDQLPDEKDKPIAIYCRSGRMSGIVAKQLAENGYTNIYDLRGGMNAWTSSGRTLITN